MSHSAGPPIAPKDTPTLDRWRASLLAYRAARRAGGNDSEAHTAAAAITLANHPDMTPAEARQDVIDAIGWVTRSEYSEWFYRGTPRPAWIWPPTAEGVGLRRLKKS
jgi:hypothetical protein